MAYGDLAPLTATIANGQSLSDAVDLGGASLMALATPAGWTTAVITFQWSPDNTTWFEFDDVNGTAVTIPSIAASKSRHLDPADFAGIRYLKVRSGTVAAAVAQTGGDSVTLMARRV